MAPAFLISRLEGELRYRRPVQLYPRIHSHWYPLNEGGEGAAASPSESGSFGEEEKSLTLTWNLNTFLLPDI